MTSCTEATELAIRDMLAEGLDMAAIATLLQCWFSDVVGIKAMMEMEAYEAARVKSALAMHCISPATETRRADKEHGKALKKMAKGDCKHGARINRPVGQGLGRAAENAVHREDTGAIPRGHGYETQNE